MLFQNRDYEIKVYSSQFIRYLLASLPLLLFITFSSLNAQSVNTQNKDKKNNSTTIKQSTDSRNYVYPKKDTTEFELYTPRIIPKPTPLEELEADLALILDNPDLNNTHIGISVIDVNSKKELFKLNSLKNFVPASVNKIFTTGAALELLGSEYQFTTNLHLSGEISLDGQFIGDLIIKGEGDPTLSEVFYDDPTVLFDDWIQQLVLLGIKSISGSIIGDDNFFDNDYYAVGWDYKDLKEPYAAQVNAISIFENKVEISIIPQDSIGVAPEYELYPENEYLNISNYLQTIGPNESSYLSVFKNPDLNDVSLYGSIYTDDRSEITTQQVAVSNPTLYFLHLFENRLNEYGIELTGELIDIDELEQDIDYNSTTIIPGWKSKPLTEIVKEVNQNSNNLVTEMILKTIARKKTGVGSFDNGTSELTKFLVSKGINPSMILLKDGSGLSRNNLISPIAVTRFLVAMNSSKVKNDFKNSLAKPGMEGTLLRRLTGNYATKNVIAKTGSMSNVSTIAGYIRTKDNQELAFCIMMNNFTEPVSVIRNIQDLLIMRLASYTKN